jgi:hypothetical protein
MKLPRLWFAKRKDELDEELRAHLRMATADRMERGEPEAEARRNAMREMGNIPLIEDVTRAMWGGVLLERVAFNSVALTHNVANAEPFQATLDEGTKPVPVRSSVCVPDPATTLAGLTAAITGGGLLIVKLAAAELPPPGAGLKTVMAAVPPSTRAAAGTVAVTEVSVENVVAIAVPFQRTADPLTKPVPETAIES